MKKLLTLFILTLVLIACGGKEKNNSEEQPLKIGASEVEKPAETDSNSVVLALAGNDMMQYDKKEFKVKAGQSVTLNFRHSGQMDKKVMGHNFVLLKPGVDITEFSIKSSEAGETADWIPEEGKDVIVHTKMLGGGESTSITFTAPAPGIYDFICSFPGHSALMRGKFIVE